VAVPVLVEQVAVAQVGDAGTAHPAQPCQRCGMRRRAEHDIDPVPGASERRAVVVAGAVRDVSTSVDTLSTHAARGSGRIAGATGRVASAGIPGCERWRGFPRIRAGAGHRITRRGTAVALMAPVPSTQECCAMTTTPVLISPTELQSLMATEPVVVIDTRDPEAYAAGHVPGAVNLREIFTYLATSTAEGLQALKSTFAEHFGAVGLSGAETAVFYEDALNNGYGQSCRGYYLLTWLGYPKIKVLDGGISAWKSDGLPISTEAVTPKPVTFPAGLAGADVMLTKDDVKVALGRADVTLLDVRDVDEWTGESSSPYGKDFAPRKGRLPGAKWIEWYRFMKPGPHGPQFKSPLEVQAECATAGIAPDDTVYLYCFKGARASNTFLALKQAGFTDVRMYFGSWNEWSRDTSLPIESTPPLIKKAAPAMAIAA
jgi:thiosulfate/3-mercaptopyruvate sulfurtransferase